MKKIIFAIILVSVFSAFGMALASDGLSNSSIEDVLLVVADLKSQVASLKAELSLKTAQDAQTNQIVPGVSEKNSNTPQSEHFVMNNLSF